MAMEKGGQLNLRGMIQLDKVEDLLSKVLERLSNHESQFENLNRICGAMLSVQSAEKSLGQLQSAVKLLSGRIDNIRETALSRIDDHLYTAGDLAVSNYKEIANIKTKMNTLAQLTDVEMKFSSFVDQYISDIKNFEESTTPIHMTLLLQSGHRENCQRISQLENLLASKLDRTEIRHIESLSKYLETFADIQKNNEKKITELFSKYEDLSNKHNMLRDDVTSIEEKSCQIEDTIKTFSSKSVVNDLIKEFDKQKKIIEQCAHKSSILQIEKWMEGMSDHTKDINSDISVMKCNLRDLEKELQTKALVSDVSKCVKREHFDVIVNSLGSDLDTKSTLACTNNIQTDIQNLSNTLAAHAQQIQVAVRFIEWFTKRGDIYEYNMKVIDNHLKTLSESAVSSNSARMPFDLNVRSTPDYNS